MRPPTSLQWLVGNPVSALVLMLGAIYLAYLWLVEGAGMGVGLLAIVIGGYAGRCAERVNAYTRWKREWEGLGGSRGPFRLPKVPGLKYVFGVGAWLSLAAMVIGSANDPAMRIPVVLFWLATAVMVVAGVYRLVRSGSGQTRRSDSVRLCLGRPMLSPSVEEARKALPHYC